MTSRPPPEGRRKEEDDVDHASRQTHHIPQEGASPSPVNPQKGNIMSIIRHEIRQTSEENRGQPIIGQAVVHGNVAYFAGITPDPIVGDIKTQTAQVLRRVDELLNLAGTNKSQQAPRSGSQTCVCSKITILFGTSGSIRQTLPRGLASRPTFGDLGCSLK
jgi:enamine deaminase RidA (YjgF/YER057c/UK114 family)